jgi:ankyrin repeat protein
MALIEDEAFLPFVKMYAEDEQLFFRDFAEAFSKLLALGCPAHVQPEVKPAPVADEEPQANKDFRDLAMHGSVERMKEIKDADVNSAEALSGRTALHKAAFFGHAHVIGFLLEQGASVNVTDADGDTALHDAARLGHIKVVEALVSAGADKNLVNKEGKTASDLAHANEKAAVVAVLAS